MALTNWLGADEWAACYWLGLREVHEFGARGGDLGLVLRAGIGRLVREGYTFRGITADAEGNYGKVTMQEDCPARVLADLITGEFDARAQADLAIRFCRANVPALDVDWLARVLERPPPV